MYAAAHNQAKLHDEPPVYCEVFIYNTSEEIMEAAVSTVYFNRGDKWFTPSSKCGGNLGTTRAWALRQEWCMEGVVTVNKVRSMHGQTIWLSNAMRGFWMARICIDEQEWDAHLKESRVLVSGS
jgi:branched-subunit amino acid aminotransferase/4-amino-4-deoxychorismate lyase